ncbi:WXG100 family type VII secretion target [Plantactinospora sonchi]|uniref:Type VII secretion target n=1 Tax=Plantactinospora sonchi TaxID=1544735 RepID=A0ABU7RWY0_9ACTN
MVRVDTAALRAAAKRLRDEAAGGVDEAIRSTQATDSGGLLGFDQYGSFDGYQAVSRAWRAELGGFAEALRQLADAMEKAADNYDRSDQNAADRFGGGPR